MGFKFNLEELRQKHNCINYLETGLWKPWSIKITLRDALKCNFKNITNVEIREDFVSKGKEIFEKEISTGRLRLINDDSTNLYKYLNHDYYSDKTLFFFDAHVDNKIIKNYKKKCPLFYELEALKTLQRKDNIILIDDLRIIKRPFPWGETSYGNINFFESIKSKILEINKDYKFATLDGTIKDDVLLCYI